MRFSRDIVLELINTYRGSQHVQSGDSRKYRWVALLPEPGAPMDPELLYVCSLSDAIKRNAENPGFHYICIRDLFSESDENEAMLSGITVINENKSLTWLFTLLQERFLELLEWEDLMKRTLIEAPDLQKLIDLSERITKNSVFVLDASYSLLAYTKNNVADEPLVTSLVETGYHTEETMELFREKHRFGVYEETDDLIISEPGVISRYEVVGKWCRSRGSPVAHVVMMCASVPRSPALVELFNMLTDYINMFFELTYDGINTVQPYSSFIHDTIYGGAVEAHVIAERSKSLHIPYTGNFNIFAIVFEDSSIVLVHRVVKEIMELLPDAKVISKNYEITVLNSYSQPDMLGECRERVAAIRPLIEKYKAHCGISSKFTSLRDMKHAFSQAASAYITGLKITGLSNYWNFDDGVFEEIMAWDEHRVFYFDDVYLFHIIHLAKTNSDDIFRNTLYQNALSRLTEYDRSHKSSLTQILYCYLITERKATVAGRILHMHRNNVLYHIGKVEEITGVSLDDPMARLKLLLSFFSTEIDSANREIAEA